MFTKPKTDREFEGYFLENLRNTAERQMRTDVSLVLERIVEHDLDSVSGCVNQWKGDIVTLVTFGQDDLAIKMLRLCGAIASIVGNSQPMCRKMQLAIRLAEEHSIDQLREMMGSNRPIEPLTPWIS